MALLSGITEERYLVVRTKNPVGHGAWGNV